MADAPFQPPVVSIVIPTHNRMALMRQMLDALEQQQPGTPPFEVVAVADGCSDGTVAMLNAYRGPFPIRVVEKPGLGPSEARNSGADVALAPLLLFLDDDVLPTSAVVAAHVASHAGQPDGAVIGPYPPAPHASRDLFRLSIRHWWTQHFAALADPAHRFSFRDVLTGNLSMPRHLWQSMGGLDPQFARAREDLELGIRLFARGVPVRYAPDALGWHHEHHTSSLVTSFRRAREEGKSDTRIALKHPHMAAQLYAVHLAKKRGLLSRMQLRSPLGRLWEAAFPIGSTLLPLLDQLGLRRHYYRLYGYLNKLAYRRGVSAAAEGQWDRLAVLPVEHDGEKLVLDLGDGIDAAEQAISASRPDAVELWHNGARIGLLPYAPGTEPWDGRHLRQALVTQLSLAMLPLITGGMGRQDKPAPPGWNKVGTRDFDHLLAEARQQWARAGL